MKTYVVKVRDGCRLTLPAEVRKLLKLEPGDKILLMKDADGNVEVTRASKKEAAE